MKKLNVLCVDDSKTVHSYVKDCLIDNLGEMYSAFDGKEALECINTDKQIDVILLDWEMPVLDGRETVKQLMEIGCEIPIIMLTAKDNPENIQEMFQLGVKEYLMKPFTKDILIGRLSEVLDD